MTWGKGEGGEKGGSMAEQRKISDAGGLAFAAVELTKAIAATNDEKSQIQDRAYWFRLYRQCVKAVQGQDVTRILQDD